MPPPMRQINRSRPPKCAFNPGGCKPGNNLSNIQYPPPVIMPEELYIPAPPIYNPPPPHGYNTPAPPPRINMPNTPYIPTPPIYEEPYVPAPPVYYNAPPPKSLGRRAWSGFKGFGKRVGRGVGSALSGASGMAGNVASDVGLGYLGLGGRRNNRRNTRKNNRKSRRNNRKSRRN